jgi:acylphosphatase
MIARRIFVRGHVQGVFYRGWCVTTARVLGLSGWVRNRGDGTVEILAWGSDQAVNALIERCREGPPAAIVEAVEVSEAEAEPSVGFEARPSA